MIHNVNLNIHYSAPQEVWDKIKAVYKSMPYWTECGDCPCWRGEGVELDASAEPGGINIYGEMPEDIWADWFDALKNRLSAALGYEIGEPEEGFPFKYWKPFIKSYYDIKFIDSEKIVFNDYSTFFRKQFTRVERDITASPPCYIFRSEYIELFVKFEKKGLLADIRVGQDFHDFEKRLNEVGIKTLDLS